MADVFSSGTFLAVDGSAKVIQASKAGYHGNFAITVDVTTNATTFVAAWNANTRYSHKQIAIVSEATTASPLRPQTVTLAGGASREDDIINYYKDRLIAQYKLLPKARETVDLFCRAAYCNLLPLTLENSFDIETAVGAQLDMIGRIIGVTRDTFLSGTYTSLSDTDYRFMLKMKILRNQLGSTLYDIDTYFWAYYPNVFSVFDHKDMSISFMVNSTNVPSTLIRMLFSKDLMPYPMGVIRSYITYIPQLDNIFGFLTNTSDTTLQTGIAGFNSVYSSDTTSYFLSETDALVI